MADQYNSLPDPCSLFPASVVKRYTGRSIEGKVKRDIRKDLENFTQCNWINLKGRYAGTLSVTLRLWHTYLDQTGDQLAADDFGQSATGKNCVTIPGVQADEQCLLPAHSTPVDMSAIIRRKNLVVEIACRDGRPNVCSGRGQNVSAGELARMVLPKL